MGVAMDVSALNLKTAGLVLGAGKKVDRVVEVRVPIVGWKGTGMGRARARSLVVVSAAGKKKNHDNPSSSGNGDPSIPEGDGADETNPAVDKSKPTDSADKSRHTLSDWRDFRANLIYRWKVNLRPNDFLVAMWILDRLLNLRLLRLYALFSYSQSMH